MTRLRGDAPAVLLPIQIMARGLDSALVVASALAARGCRAVVGDEGVLKSIARGSDRVVWQGKGLFADQGETYLVDTLLARKTAIMALTDEGAMHTAGAWTETVLQKHDIENIRQRPINRICVWGERQKAVLSAHAPESARLIGVTGCPRFDLCHPKFAWMTSIQATDISTHSPYILVCTRFSSIANAKGPGEPFLKRLNPRLWPAGVDMSHIADLWFAKWHRDVHDFGEFVIMIRALAARHPDRTVIVRPHPSESVEFYKQALVTEQNIVVTRIRSALDWIRQADLVVHCNCTTGVEAVLAGRPVLNFLPRAARQDSTDVEIAREAGVAAASVEEVLERATGLLAAPAPAQAWSDSAHRMLNNLTAEAIPLMVEETLAVLKDARLESSRVKLPSERLVSRLGRLVLRPKGAPPSEQHSRLHPAYVESVLDGCRAHAIGGGRVAFATQGLAVIDPA